jgi:sarcosine reductase
VKLELGNIMVKDVVFGEQTQVVDGIVHVNKGELMTAIADERLICRDIHIVKPGDSVRLCPVKDVLEPRVKVAGPGSVFPGFSDQLTVVGEGRTHVLKGMTVITVGNIVGFQEGIIDMSGPGAEYTPFAQTINLVIDCNKADGIKQHEHEEAIRMVGLKATRYIAEAARHVVPDEILTYETKPIPEQLQEYPDLPRVAYVYMLQTQGLLHDTYVYGVDAKKILPTFMFPTEVMDLFAAQPGQPGFVFSFVSVSFKNLHQFIEILIPLPTIAIQLFLQTLESFFQ